MARATRKKANICEVCSEMISKSTTRPFKAYNHFWSFLFHQIVSEALLPSISVSNTEQNEDDFTIPKLILSLTLGTAVSPDSAKHKLKFGVSEAWNWNKWINYSLQQQQLQAFKKLISCQINKTNDKRLEQEDS